MPSVAVIGGQWGDEGKAKIVDLLGGIADAVVRTSGGNNAGHTVTFNGERYRFSSLPCGLLHENCLGILGNGTAVNPPELLEEMDRLKEKGLNVDNVRISSRAHVVMPYHVILDGLMDEVKNDEKTDPASSRRGIRPCYMDKFLKDGIRMCDLLDPELFAKKVRNNVNRKNRMISRVYGGFQQCDAEKIIEEYVEYGRRLAPYVCDTAPLLQDMLEEGKRIVFEGAQATMLDPDFGTYPFVTSSTPSIGGVLTGSGVGIHGITHVVGVMKGYVTRSGQGPLPTELFGPEANALREHGNEFETNGYCRRVGWFDAVAARYSVRVNGIKIIALNKLNSLNYLDEVKICTGYRYQDQILTKFPASSEILDNIEPIYETFPGWNSIEGCTSFEDLPENVQKYISRIEELVGARVSVVELSHGKMIVREPVSNWT